MAYISSNSSDSLFGPAYHGPLRRFDFTLLFEDTILTIVPATLFLVAASARAIWLTNKPNKVATSLSRLTKLVRPSPEDEPGVAIRSRVTIDATKLPFSSKLRLMSMSAPVPVVLNDVADEFEHGVLRVGNSSKGYIASSGGHLSDYATYFVIRLVVYIC